MAIVLGKFASRKGTANSCYQAGVVTVSTFEVDASAGLKAADIVDFGVLPAGCVILDAAITSDATVGTANANIGFLTGDTAALTLSDGTPRVLTNEIFNGVALATTNATVAKMVNAAARTIKASDKNRSIGLQVSADIAAGAGKVIRMDLYYTAPTP